MLTLYTNNPFQKRENLCQTKPYVTKRALLIALYSPFQKAGINPAYQYKIVNVEMCNYLLTLNVSILFVPLVTCTTFKGSGVSHVGLPKTCMSFLTALKMPKDTHA